jgi:alanine dehydrogenase
VNDSDFLWINEAQVVRLLDMRGAIATLQVGLGQEATGHAKNMVKTHVHVGDAVLHAIGGAFLDDGFIGTKTWTHTPNGATPLLILFDSHDGSLRAVIEAFALGQLRTGGVSGVATHLLAASDADDMGLIGTGKQALTQLAAVAAVRRLRRVRVFSPNEERRDTFVERARRELELPIEAASSAQTAVKDASIVTLITRAKQPFLGSNDIARGAHVNAIGAITPERCEMEPAILGRCAVIAVDSIPQVRELSREFREHFGHDESAWRRVTPLSALLASGMGRPAGADLTVFKAMGIGIADLALAMHVYRLAREHSLGTVLPYPQRSTPRLRSARSV